jgi:capsular polysaccharide biosynthesis protein
MEELEIKDILNIFQQKLVMIIILTAIITASGILYTLFIQTPMYKSNVTMVLATPTNTTEEATATSTITQGDLLLNQKLVSTYSEIIKSRKISSQVIINLGLKYSIEQWNSMISVNSRKDTEMLEIVVTNANPEIAASIVNNVAEVFSKEIVNIYNIKNVSIIDKGIVASSPYNISIIKQVILFFFSGIIISLFLSFILYYFDTTVKDPEEVEKRLGMSVLSVIPVYLNK